MQFSLQFPRRGNFSLVRLEAADAASNSDAFIAFQNQILQNEQKYPSIAQWLTRKVSPGIVNGERAAFVAYCDELPVATAVFKRGERAKICHLNISEDYQDQHLGEMFFALMVLEARASAKHLHFTLPESLWERERGFFSAFGFSLCGRAARQYRNGEQELWCGASIQAAWDSTVQKLPKLASVFAVSGLELDADLLLSVRPHWAHRILQGQKKVEIRRKFSTKWSDKWLSLYSSKPEGKLVGKAKVGAVVPGDPVEIWKTFGAEIGCSREEFDVYVKGCREVFAIVLSDVRAYRKPIDIAELAKLVGGGLLAPQSYQTVQAQSNWGRAISLAMMMQAGIEKQDEVVASP